MSKKGLGKGLGALLPELGGAEPKGTTQIEIQRIKPNPEQPRKQFDPERLAELAESIRLHGVVQPVVVRPKDGHYELVAGERRWRAAQMAGLATVPAVVREFSDAQVMEIALIENLQREDLNPIEEARAFRKLIDEFKLTQDDLAQRLGKSRPHITNTLRLLQLDVRVQEMVADGQLSMGHAKAILGLENAVRQQAVAAEVLAGGWSVRQTEERVRRESGSLEAGGKPKGSRSGRSDAKRSGAGLRSAGQWDWIADELRHRLGAPVQIVNTDGRGKIEIHFFGPDDLDRITELLLGGDVPRGTKPAAGD